MGREGGGPSRDGETGRDARLGLQEKAVGAARSEQPGAHNRHHGPVSFVGHRHRQAACARLSEPVLHRQREGVGADTDEGCGHDDASLRLGIAQAVEQV